MDTNRGRQDNRPPVDEPLPARVATVDDTDHTASGQDATRSYNPENILAALRAAKGAFRGLDSEQLLRDLHAQREQDSHGRPADDPERT